MRPQKSVWTNIEYTGVLDNGANYDPSIDYAQIGLLDAGECLVDNIEVDYNGTNYVSNGTFEGSLGLTNWSLQGCMVRSSLENPGYQSSYSPAHPVQRPDLDGRQFLPGGLELTNALAAGQTVTLSYEARWLHGWPEPLLRLNGNWLEATGAAAGAQQPGHARACPTARYITNAGPAIYNVTHTPAGAGGQSAGGGDAPMCSDPDGVTNLTLYYRLDPATNYTRRADDGQRHGRRCGRRATAFSARRFPGRRPIKSWPFIFRPRTVVGAATRFPALRPSDNEPVRECVVMFGDGNPGGSFGVYHLWLTQTNVNRWANLSDLSNEGNDCTFVNGNRVIYNMQGRFAGSPYHQEFDTPDRQSVPLQMGVSTTTTSFWARRISTRSISRAMGRAMTPAFSASNWPTRFCGRWACRGSTAAMWRCMSTATGAAR